MKIIIFAGGVGSRLWPLSRKNSPKQFEKIFGEHSTLQATIARLQPEFSPQDIFVATGSRYEAIVREQLPEIPSDNFIFEPEMRDVGPAIGLASMLVDRRFQNEPIAIVWSDHMVKNTEAFKNGLLHAQKLVEDGKSKFVFIAQKPRFANQNMGWIEVGEGSDIDGVSQVFPFKKLCYRPTYEQAQSFFSNKSYVWNLGYFVTTPLFLAELFLKYTPDMYRNLKEIVNAWGSSEYESKLKSIYPTLEKISFDDAILMKMGSDSIHVISSDLGWSDVGAWESLKEALAESDDENVTKGKVLLEDTVDALAFNYTNQLVVGIDLKEFLVINTQDVVLVCPKTSVPKIKKLVEKLAGTEHESLT